jgi:hypothetical protein
VASEAEVEGKDMVWIRQSTGCVSEISRDIRDTRDIQGWPGVRSVEQMIISWGRSLA